MWEYRKNLRCVAWWGGIVQGGLIKSHMEAYLVIQLKKNNWKLSITLVKFHSQDRRLKDWVSEDGRRGTEVRRG